MKNKPVTNFETEKAYYEAKGYTFIESDYIRVDRCGMHHAGLDVKTPDDDCWWGVYTDDDDNMYFMN